MKDKKTVELLEIYSNILTELNDRKVVRTYNSPVGDYAEFLIAKSLGLKLEKNSKKGYDAIDEETNVKYQIKSRWERDFVSKGSRKLSVIRNYEDNQFDFLIIVIFDAQFNVKNAYKLPHHIIKNYATYNAHQNGFILHAIGEFTKDNETEDIAEQIKAAQYAI